MVMEYLIVRITAQISPTPTKQMKTVMLLEMLVIFVSEIMNQVIQIKMVSATTETLFYQFSKASNYTLKFTLIQLLISYT